MDPPPRCTPSSPNTSSRGRRSSPTPGRVTGVSTSSATPTNRAANGPLAPAGKTPASSFPASTALRPWSSGGCQLGTHQGSVDEAHLQGYLNEFVFRFNRRGSRSRGLVFHRVLELAVAHDPVRYRDLVVNPQPKAAPPVPPGIRGHPPSMDRPRAARPWRASRPGLVRSDEYPRRTLSSAPVAIGGTVLGLGLA